MGQLQRGRQGGTQGEGGAPPRPPHYCNPLHWLHPAAGGVGPPGGAPPCSTSDPMLPPLPLSPGTVMTCAGGLVASGGPSGPPPCCPQPPVPCVPPCAPPRGLWAFTTLFLPLSRSPHLHPRPRPCPPRAPHLLHPFPPSLCPFRLPSHVARALCVSVCPSVCLSVPPLPSARCPPQHPSPSVLPPTPILGPELLLYPPIPLSCHFLPPLYPHPVPTP